MHLYRPENVCQVGLSCFGCRRFYKGASPEPCVGGAPKGFPFGTWGICLIGFVARGAVSTRAPLCPYCCHCHTDRPQLTASWNTIGRGGDILEGLGGQNIQLVQSRDLSLSEALTSILSRLTILVPTKFEDVLINRDLNYSERRHWKIRSVRHFKHWNSTVPAKNGHQMDVFQEQGGKIDPQQKHYCIINPVTSRQQCSSGYLASHLIWKSIYQA